MYICICNAIRDADLRAAVSKGARSTDEAFEGLGSRPNCGSCLDLADEIVAEEIQARQLVAEVPASR